MGRTQRCTWLLVAALACAAGDARAAADQALSALEAACNALAGTPNLTITYTELVSAGREAPQHCYIRGLISGSIRFHMQLPLPSAWNGRLVNIGDGGKDGVLNYADSRVAQGYAVANSNSGHDGGAEPLASFAFNNRQAEIDFGYRAIHLTATASKTVVNRYYGRNASYSYFEGCSTGGRQGLMEAQRFPYDFNGIIAGAPVNNYQALNTTHVWMLQRVYRNNFAGNLAFDSKGDGSFESLSKVNLLRDAVLAKCDGKDGIKDGVIDDPLGCDFNPDVDLAGRMCPGDVNADACLTRAQLQTIKDAYSGSYDSKGKRILKGKAYGSEFGWASHFLPHKGNGLFPGTMRTSPDHVNFLFYENDPGVSPPDPTNLSYTADRKANPPEFAWWEFNIDDVTAGKGNFMMAITDSTDPDLTRFLNKNNGKLILYHGWGDAGSHPEPTLDYYKNVVATTFKGDIAAAKKSSRLFMVPGMDHCQGGPGPNAWDKLPALVEWVENGKAPDFVVATHSSNGRVDNERPICAYPQRAMYTGPAGGENNPANWVASNFTCK